MSSLSISVALATYNGEKFIREQLQSLAEQTTRPSELVVTDDRSTDATVDIVEQFARTAPFPVRVSRNARTLGFAENFLQAASLCQGDLVSFCDQDDRWLPHKLETCARPFADSDVAICVHVSRLWFGGEQVGDLTHVTNAKNLLPGESDPFENYPGFSIVIRNRIFRSVDHSVRPRHPNIVKSISLSPHPMVHDQWTWFIGSSFGNAVYVAEPQALYRQHHSNVQGWMAPDAPVAERLSLDKARIFEENEQVAFECADFIEKAAAPLSKEIRANAARSAAAMRARAKIFQLRKAIYQPRSTFRNRVGAFIDIYKRHGYAARRDAFSFGSSALLKDLVVGVPGAARLLRRARN